jgi:DNA-binding MurR/RpiR family transcriptional regulator
MGSMTAAERRVARALLASYPAAGLDSAGSLAATAQTSAATVVRLVQKLGFDGFPGFQTTLRAELSSRRVGPIDRAAVAPPGDAREKILHDLSQALSDLAATVSATVPPTEFAAAVRLLADNRRTIWLLGGRASQPLAVYIAAHLSRFRSGVSVLPRYAGGHDAVLVDANRRTVLVAFDFRRYEQETVEVAALATERGAKVIVVTDTLMSPATASAEVVLPVAVEVPSPFDSSVGGLVLAEALLEAVLMEMGPTAVERMRRWDQLADRHLIH